jgi:hypothetical protein
METKSQTKMKLIEVIDKFIIYMLSDNDEEKIIYAKLIELEGEELEDWVNDRLKQYLVCEFGYEEGDIYVDSTKFHRCISVEYDSIFTNCREFLEIQVQLESYDMDRFQFSYEDIINCYCYMYIDEMSATELKEYIINLLDPVEPK